MKIIVYTILSFFAAFYVFSKIVDQFNSDSFIFRNPIIFVAVPAYFVSILVYNWLI